MYVCAVQLEFEGWKDLGCGCHCKQSLGLLKCIIFFLLMFSPSYHKCLCISSQRCFPLKVNQGQLSSSMMLFHRGTLLRGHVSHGVDVM